jgi:hypothetical protein
MPYLKSYLALLQLRSELFELQGLTAVLKKEQWQFHFHVRNSPSDCRVGGTDTWSPRWGSPGVCLSYAQGVIVLYVVCSRLHQTGSQRAETSDEVFYSR